MLGAVLFGTDRPSAPKRDRISFKNLQRRKKSVATQASQIWMSVHAISGRNQRLERSSDRAKRDESIANVTMAAVRTP